jgi:hypothetical protein
VGGFADDSQLYLSFKPDSDRSKTEAVQKMDDCINAVRSWMLQHKLKINDAKTEFIIIGGQKQLQKVTDCAVTVGRTQIKPVDKVRNLGMVFDEHLSMKDHMRKVCKAGFHQLYRLRQLRKYFDDKSMESLVHSFVTSHIDYGNAMFAGLPDVTIGKLQRLQNAAARLVTRSSKYDSITAILKERHWLPVKYRVKFKICLLVYKCLHGIGPHYLSELLEFPQSTRTLRSTSNNLLYVPKMKTESFGKRSFKYVAPSYWNELPLSVRKCDKIDNFKAKLKTHLFTVAFG